MTASQSLHTILSVDRAGVEPVILSPRDKACYSIASLAAKAGIPLTAEILAEGVAEFDYYDDTGAPGIWFEVE